jgi:hypothetical protein
MTFPWIHFGPIVVEERLHGHGDGTVKGMVLFAFACLGAARANAGDWCPVPVEQAQQQLGAHPIALPPKGAEPHPLARVHTEGTLPHQGIRDQSLEAERDWPMMLNAALAWRTGVNEHHFDTARRFLLAWVETYIPDLNPIDETNLDALIDTYAILADRLDDAERARVSAWLKKWGWDYVASIDHAPRQSGIWTNNWQSHRIKLVTMIAVATGDDRLFAEARRLFRKQIAVNLLPNGEVADFADRDALHYVVYDLEPLLRAALAARAYKREDWYHWTAPGGGSIARSVAWLTPYATGEKMHEEFVHSRVPFDAQRAAAGVKGFEGPFDVKDAAPTYWLASRFDPALRPVAQNLASAPPLIALCIN